MALNKRQLHLIINRLRFLPTGNNLFNYIANSIKYQLAKKKKKLILPFPNSIMLELTNHCQLKCITCAREYSFGSQMARGNMKLELVKKFIDDNHIYIDKLGLTGLGEPFIYPYLEDLLNYIRIKNKGIIIFISTNASLPNSIEILEKIKAHFNTLQVSIDGTGEVFEEIRKNSDFNFFLNNLKNIMEISRRGKFDVKLNMVVFDKNFKQMKDVVSIANDFGIDEIYFNTINLVANDWDLKHYELYHTQEFKEELNASFLLAKKYNINLIFPKMEMMKSFSNCPYPWNNFYISWDGYLVACCAKPFPKELNFGNVFDSGFMNCLNTIDFQKFREMSIKGISPGFCKRCHYIE